MLFATARSGPPPPSSGRESFAPQRRCGCRARRGSAFGRVDRQPVAALDDGLDRPRCAQRRTQPRHRGLDGVCVSPAARQLCEKFLPRHHPPGVRHQPPQQRHRGRRHGPDVAVDGHRCAAHADVMTAGGEMASAAGNLVADQPGQRTQPVAVGVGGRDTEPSQRRRRDRPHADRRHLLAQRGDEFSRRSRAPWRAATLTRRRGRW